MPIAVTVPVQPSRLLRLVLLGYALACVAAALAMLAGSRFHLVEAGAAACLLSAVLAARAARASEMRHVIDVSGLGEIRLTVQQHMACAASRSGLVHLLPGSTIWPHCLLLLLRDTTSGAITALAILPDSMPPDAFRNLSIAIRAIARRDNKFFEKNQIL